MFGKIKKLKDNKVMTLFVFVPISIFFFIIEISKSELFLKSSFADAVTIFNGHIYRFNLEVLVLVLGLFYLIGLGTVRKKIVEIRKENAKARNITIVALETIAKAVDAKDPDTKGHSQRVANYAAEISKRRGSNEIMQENIYYAGLLHDIGKIGISDNILNKPGELTNEEREKIENHTLIGYNILKDFNLIDKIAQGAGYHHERLNGLGYPKGLKNDEIPMVAKIIAVADVYDAINSERVYKNSVEKVEVIQILENGKGTDFDPEIVDIMIDIAKNGIKEPNYFVKDNNISKFKTF